MTNPFCAPRADRFPRQCLTVTNITNKSGEHKIARGNIDFRLESLPPSLLSNVGGIFLTPLNDCGLRGKYRPTAREQRETLWASVSDSSSSFELRLRDRSTRLSKSISLVWLLRTAFRNRKSASCLSQC